MLFMEQFMEQMNSTLRAPPVAPTPTPTAPAASVVDNRLKITLIAIGGLFVLILALTGLLCLRCWKLKRVHRPSSAELESDERL